MRRFNLSSWLLGAVVFVLLASGCGVDRYLGNTKLIYKDLQYESNKNQEGLKASGKFDPVGNLLEFSVETTATTPEAAIAAARQSDLEMLKLLNALAEQARSRGTAGGVTVPPVASPVLATPPTTPPAPVPPAPVVGGPVAPSQSPRR